MSKSYQIKGIEFIFSLSPCCFKPVLSVNYYFYNTVIEFIWLRKKNEKSYADQKSSNCVPQKKEKKI